MKVQKVAAWINKSKTAQKVLRGVSDNPALASAGISFVAAAIMRPAAQSMLPIKNKDDRQYTIGSSVATGVTELALAAAIFIPSNKAIQHTSKALYNSQKNTIYKENNLLLRQFKSLSNRFLKLGLMPVTSWLRFAAIAPIVKLLFRHDKEVIGDKKIGGHLNHEG